MKKISLFYTLLSVILVMVILVSCNKHKNPSAIELPIFMLTGTPVIILTETQTSTQTSTTIPTQTSTPTPIPAKSWKTVGQEGLSAGSADFPRLCGYNGELYIIYVDKANGNKATVKKFDGAQWVDFGGGVVSSGLSTRTTMDIDENGSIYIAYEDSSKNIYVKKYNNGIFEAVGTVSFAGDIWAESFVVRNGVPYVAYQSSYMVYLSYYDGANWQTYTPFGSGGWYSQVDFVGDIPYVTYETGSYNTEISYYQNGVWNTLAGSGYSTGSEQISTKVYNGDIYMFYYISTSVPKTILRKYSEGSWTNTYGFTPGNTFGNHMIIDNGVVYVIFTDKVNGGRASVMKYEGNAWSSVGNYGFSVGEVGYNTLYIYNGIIYAAYFDQGIGGKAIVKKYD